MKVNKKVIINSILAIVIYAVVMVLINTGLLNRQLTSLIVPVCTYVIMAVSLCLVVGFLG